MKFSACHSCFCMFDGEPQHYYGWSFYIGSHLPRHLYMYCMPCCFISATVCFKLPLSSNWDLSSFAIPVDFSNILCQSVGVNGPLSTFIQKWWHLWWCLLLGCFRRVTCQCIQSPASNPSSPIYQPLSCSQNFTISSLFSTYPSAPPCSWSAYSNLIFACLLQWPPYSAFILPQLSVSWNLVSAIFINFTYILCQLCRRQGA